MADDVLLNKIATIENCLARIDEEYSGHEAELETNYTRQDTIILNERLGAFPEFTRATFPTR